jgi:flagellar biosynthesis protein FlhG
MNWEQTLRHWVAPRNHAAERALVAPRAAGALAAPAASLCIASGKGGTGKSVVAASLAELLARRGRTLLVDADLGVGNAHILHDVHPARTLVDVVAGRCTVAEARVRCAPELDLVGGGSGVSHMASLSACELHLIAQGLAAIEREYRYVVVDSAAGISDQTLAFAAACDAVLVVTTPDATSMTDAYAFIKVLHARRPDLVPLLAVNRVGGEGDREAAPERLPEATAELAPDATADLAPDAAAELVPEATAEFVFGRLGQVCRRFLGLSPRAIGAVPDDRAVARSVASRRPVVRDAPASRAALALHDLADAVEDALASPRREGLRRLDGGRHDLSSWPR